MRAEGHYVDLLAARSTAPREETLSTHLLSSDTAGEPAPALIESIRHHGILQPLLVQEQDDEYRVIAGHKRLRAARAAGLRDVPCIVHQVGDDKATQLASATNISGTIPAPPPVVEPEPAAASHDSESFVHAGAALAQSLNTITTCAELLSASPSDLTRSVMGHLVQAESARAAALLLATRIVRHELTAVRTAVDVNSLCDRVARSFSAERKVRRVSVESRGGAAAGTCVTGDETMLAAALSAAVMATLPLVEAASDATITLGAGEEDGHVVLTVAQRQATPVSAWQARAFDPQWNDRPGGGTALVSFLAARHVAEIHSGILTISADGSGTTISLRLPASR